LTSTCAATKRDGSPCTLPSSSHSDLCWAHDPKNAERRRRGQSRGGKNKPSRELSAIKSLLEDLAEQVLAGDLETGRAAVANQLVNTRLRAIEVERKIRAEEIEERLSVLEEQLPRNVGGRRWG
jgi:hypothetical protein